MTKHSFLKYFLFILSFGVGLFVKAQVKYPVVYYYPVSIDDKFFNYRIFQQDSTIYTIPYSGGINTLGNLGEIVFHANSNRYGFLHIYVKGDSSVIGHQHAHNFVYLKKKRNLEKIKIPDFINGQKNILLNDTLYYVSKDNRAIYKLESHDFIFALDLPPSYEYNFFSNNHQKVISRYKNNQLEIASFHGNSELTFRNAYIAPDFKNILQIDDSVLYYVDNKKSLLKSFDGKVSLMMPNFNQKSYYHWGLSKNNKQNYDLSNQINKKHYPILIDEFIYDIIVDEKYQTAYYATSNALARSFMYLNTIPNAFNHKTSKSCFTLTEDTQGNILAGSYLKDFSVIQKDTIIAKKNNRLKYLVGRLNFNNSTYFTGELEPYNGIHRYHGDTFKKVIGSDVNEQTGYYLFKSSQNNIYYGTNKKRLWEIDSLDLVKNNGKWKKIQKDIDTNILTITEDKYGRIYYAGGGGVGIYSPESSENTFYSKRRKEIDFGALSSITDNYGTIWLGGMNGIYYCNPSKNNPKAKDFKHFNHPFAKSSTITTAFSLYKDYLIIANQNKICVLDTKKFHEENEINIKYLTSIETNFSATTEQNTLLTAKDNSIWFSTTDMIYHWDIKKWFQIPKVKISPKVCIKDKINTKDISALDYIKLKPKENSFKLSVDYATQDRLPRYMQFAFQYEADSLVWSKVLTAKSISQDNLKAGDYHLHIRIFELDGTTTYITKKIILPKFWHERWYVWALIGIFGFGLALFFIYDMQQRKLAYEKVKTERAKWLKERESIRKKLSQLQLTSISNQFRPHFLLNTFNSIGAHLDSGSYEETLLDTLGNSIDILFSMAKEEKNYHTFQKEWQLVLNIIKIYNLVYIKDLKFQTTNGEVLDRLKNVKLPFGILQIPVENALLHGLHNKPTPPYNLTILIEEINESIVFKIRDNGVGIEKAKRLSNVRKNGTGLKNLERIIRIFNQYNSHKISFEFNKQYKGGTEVIISIPKIYTYEITN